MVMVLVLGIGLLAVGTLTGCGKKMSTPICTTTSPSTPGSGATGTPDPWSTLTPAPWFTDVPLPPNGGGGTPGQNPGDTPTPTPDPPTPPPDGGKTVYLTFDDGPEGFGYTSSIATKLSNEGIEATFFLIGELEDGTHLLPALASHVETIRDGGHAIGIHGWTHRAWNSGIDYLTEIQTMHDALLDALGSLDDKLLRAPYGAFAPPPYSGYEGWYYYGWTMPQGDPKDNYGTDANTLVGDVKQMLEDAPPDNLVMLLHSNRPGTYHAIVDPVDTSSDLIQVLKDCGYTQFRKLPRPGDLTNTIIWP